MKILLVTDGRYPESVNGVSIYIRYFAEEMVKIGHNVHVFHHIKSGFLKRPRVIQSNENGLKYYGLYNSSICFSEALIHPLRSCRQKTTEKIFTDLLEQLNPDIVHFHEFHRTPSHCIALCKAQDIPSVVTLHDYWFICPRLQLFTLDKHICEGPNEGKNCVVKCLADGFITRQYRKVITMLPDGYMLKGIKKLRNMYKKTKGEHLGQNSSHIILKKNPSCLKNRSLIEEFEARYIYNKSILLKADLILAVSSCVKKAFEKHGINHNKIVVNQLGVKSVEWVKKKVHHFEHYPIRFGFLGHLGPLKGAQLIVKAAKTISPDRAEFYFFGGADNETLYDFENSTKDLKHCKYMGKYDYKRLDDIFNCFDILIVPSICQETLGMIGLEAQAAGIPIIASDIGGMRDYIRQGINGFLFSVGDIEGLKKHLSSILECPNKIEEMSRHSVTPKTIEENCREITGYYELIINQSIN